MSDITHTRNFFYSSHHLVNGKWSLNNNSSDLFYTILSFIKKEDKEFNKISFSMADLAERTGRTWSHKHLKGTVDDLQSKNFTIEEDNGDWSKYCPIPTIKFKDGFITCYPNEQMKPFLIDISKRFVKGDLRILYQLKSGYIKRIYLLLKEYQKIGKRRFILEDLLDTLNVPKSFYTYGNFKLKVLNATIKEINKHTDIYISLKEDKKGTRKVQAIEFQIRGNWGRFSIFKEHIVKEFAHQKLTKLEFMGKDNTPKELWIAISKEGKPYNFFDNNMSWTDKKAQKKIWDKLYEKREEIFSSCLLYTSPSPRD